MKLHSPRLLELKKHRRNIFFGKIFSILAVFLVFFVGLTFLSRLKQLNISEVRVTGNKIIDASEIEEVVQKEISGRYSWVFPKSNVFLYPKGSLRTELKNKFKRLKVVNLSITENQILNVDVFEREGLYTWCSENIPSIADHNEEKCYFIDENGFIFSVAPFFSGEVYFKFYGPTDGKGDPVGSSILSGSFEKLTLFMDALSNMRLKPVALYTKDNQEIRIFLERGKISLLGPEIIFPVDADLENLAANLDTALNTEPLLSNFKKKYSSLEYIDLRFGNKVYYRFR